MAKTKKQGRREKRFHYGDTIKSIYSLFIKPFLNNIYLHDFEYQMEDGLKLFFHVKSRHVYFAKALESFPMLGKMWHPDGPHVVIPRITNVRVAKGDNLVVRFDSTMPDRNEIEFGSNVFVLNELEWNQIRPKLELVC